MSPVECCDCGQPINTRTDLHFEEVQGWVKKRRQGGANAVTGRRPTGRYRCKTCQDRSSKSWEQLEMFQ